jgi:UDP-N-acetylmuramoyl-tripeptide--D-alanyl-D-alanine ligase
LKKKKKKMKNQNNKAKKIIFLEKTLRVMAVLLIKKYKPRIVGITGSVGKTSSKEAIYAVLLEHFRVKKTEKNYNNEIGLPLSIIGTESGGKSILKWTGVFLKWLGFLFFPLKYPEILILEMGADRPGDIKYLTDFILPESVVITEISLSHLEYFKTVDKIAQEKWTLVERLKPKGFAAINIDNQKIKKLKEQNKRDDITFLTFGFSEGSDILATDIAYNYSGGTNDNMREIKGLSFKLNYKGTSIPVRLNNILAKHNIYAALSAVAIGISFKLNLVEIAGALENFSMPLGRMNLLSGIKNTSIIDDTYNSSPIATISALDVMKNIEAPRKIVVLGDMLELGEETEFGHRNVAKKFLEIENGIFFAVGERMRFAVEELKKHSIDPKRVFVFSDPISAGKKLQEIIQSGDLILAKGSQGMRMEKVVEEIMAEPQLAEKLLCRQSEIWKNIPWNKV